MGDLGDGTGSSYPAALDTDTNQEVNSPSASKTKARAEVPNDLAAAVIAVQTELGTDPAGTVTDVKTFLQTEHNTDGTHESGHVVQRVFTLYSTSDTGSVILPLDNSIPQNNEGDEYITQAITPQDAANILYIDVHLMLGHTANDSSMGVALFQDSTASAISASVSARNAANANICKVTLRHIMTAGTTSSTTFKVRAGSALAGTTTTNNIFGGVDASSISITEVKP